MKRIVTSIVICLLVVLSMALIACVDNNGESNFPNSNDMKVNLEKNGYTVSVTTDLGDRKGTHLSATKEDEFIEFYWLEDSADCDYFYDKAKKDFPNYNAAAVIENDEKYGNLVYCGTVTAVEDAGIKTVVVKVDVEV